MKTHILVLIMIVIAFGCSSQPKENKAVIEPVIEDSLVEYKSVIDLTERDARQRINQNNLVVKDVKYENDSLGITTHYVLRVEWNGKELKGGDRIPKYSELTLVLNSVEAESD